jgi:hypothetical protein
MLLGSCKPRLSNLSEATETDINAVLNQFDPALSTSVDGMLIFNSDGMSTIDKEIAKEHYLRYNELTARSEDNRPKFWDQGKTAVFEFNRQEGQPASAFVVPRGITYQVALKNGTTVPLQVLFTAEDVLRSSAWVRNMIAQANSGYWQQKELPFPPGSSETLSLPAQKVRIAKTNAGVIIGFNLLNHFSDWGLQSPTAQAPAADQAATTSSSSTNYGCDADYCSANGIGASDEQKPVIAALPTLYESAITNVVGLDVQLIKNPSYHVASLNDSSRSDFRKKELCHGDVFTVLDGAVKTVGSGFGVYVANSANGCVPLSNTKTQDVLIFGKLGGQMNRSLQAIVGGLKFVKFDSPTIEEATVTSASVEAAGEKQDLRTFSGDLYKWKWDVRGMLGTSFAISTSADQNDYFQVSGRSQAKGRNVEFVDTKTGYMSETLIGSLEKPEGRAAIAPRTVQADLDEIQSRTAGLQQVNEKLLAFLQSTVGGLNQAIGGLERFRTSDTVLFDNIKLETEKTIVLEDQKRLADDARYFAGSIVGARAQYITPEVQAAAQAAAQAATQLAVSSLQVIESVNALIEAVSFVGLYVPISEKLQAALTASSQSIKLNNNAIANWNRPLWDFVSGKAIGVKDISYTEFRRAGRGGGLTKDVQLAYVISEWTWHSKLRAILKEVTGEEPPLHPAQDQGAAGYVLPDMPNKAFSKYSPEKQKEITEYFDRNFFKIWAALDSVLLAEGLDNEGNGILSSPSFIMSTTGKWKKCSDQEKNAPAVRGQNYSCVYNVGGSRRIIAQKMLMPLAKLFEMQLSDRLKKMSELAAQYGRVEQLLAAQGNKSK